MIADHTMPSVELPGADLDVAKIRAIGCWPG